MSNKLRKSRNLALILSLLLAAGALAPLATEVEAQQQRSGQGNARSTFNSAYVNGYRDAYTQGQNDQRSGANRDFRMMENYQQAERGYTPSVGNRNAYREGYRIGFELGYIDGYYGRTYTAQVPSNAFTLRNRPGQAAINDTGAFNNNSGAFNNNNSDVNSNSRYYQDYIIPSDTVLRVRLQDTISTKTSSEGDRFTAVVVEPSNYRDATIEGHIARLDRSGRLTGRTEMILEFDRITLRNGRSGRMAAQVEQVHASEDVKTIDEEGNIETSSRSDDTTLRTGGGAALGAIIGAIAGGGKGAAIGALIGAGVGAGSVYVQGRKDLILDPGTEMSIRTTGPASASR